MLAVWLQWKMWLLRQPRLSRAAGSRDTHRVERVVAAAAELVAALRAAEVHAAAFGQSVLEAAVWTGCKGRREDELQALASRNLLRTTLSQGRGQPLMAWSDSESGGERRCSLMPLSRRYPARPCRWYSGSFSLFQDWYCSQDRPAC